MKISKIVPFILFLFLGIQHAYCQTYKFKTSSFSVLEKKSNGKWGEWTDLNLVNILVSLDTNKNRIIIYSQAIQLFEIIEYQTKEENDSDIVYSFYCKDNVGENCTLSIITRKKQENRKQLYINYDNRIVVYNIFTM